MGDAFVVCDAAMASADLSMSPRTLRFNDPNVERDFVRFRVTKGRVWVFVIVIAVFGANQFLVYRKVGQDAAAYGVASAIALATILLELLLVAFRTPTSPEGQSEIGRAHV